MKSMIVYSSKTGNTKKVAEAIFDVMPMGTDIFAVEDAPLPDGYDFIVLGFWVKRENADQKAQGYMGTIKGKKVALFATLGAEPDSSHAQKSMLNAKKLLDSDNKIMGEFICRGKIDPKVTESLMKLAADNPHAMTQERLAHHKASSNHPNMEDLQNARKAFKEILRRKN
ncbi:flavodoxin family protein [Candidatus Contubernalis alkaliaceticus]|uniref:flavodoxin family protein n=1 Tax=Candidatus Contubernalis alkaliaceticus TaxID=338645 RepID=UPI001F4C033A|nr:flavodoxin family protein [Candidatus Contubernalis alkalaceticus]UNC93074.1 flavodoxin [Candidatus Contubernalis alkalaceticus]